MGFSLYAEIHVILAEYEIYLCQSPASSVFASSPYRLGATNRPAIAPFFQKIPEWQVARKCPGKS